MHEMWYKISKINQKTGSAPIKRHLSSSILIYFLEVLFGKKVLFL